MGTDGLTTLVAWLLTYAIHSTLLLGAAWALTSLPGLRAPRLAQTLWRTALFGGLLTASVHVFLGAPLWHTAIVERSAPAVPASLAVAPLEAVVPVTPPASVPRPFEPVTRPPPPVPAAPSPASDGGPGWSWLLLLWPAGIVVGLTRARHLEKRLVETLAGRADVVSGELDCLLRQLEREAGLVRRVRLTVSETISSPVAIGTWRPEVCLPQRALDTLAARHLEAMVAHEVAHLARADPAWLRSYRAITALLFFQPLNHLAVARLRNASEMLCDAWAARREGGRLALAECLTTVAEWILERAAPVTAPTMARRSSLLGRRVRHLLGRRAVRESPRRLGVVTAMLPVVLVLALAPGVRGTFEPAFANPEPRSPPIEAASPLAALDGEFDALAAEIDNVLDLLAETGRTRLAARLEARRRALEAGRLRLDREVKTRNELDKLNR